MFGMRLQEFYTECIEDTNRQSMGCVFGKKNDAKSAAIAANELSDQSKKNSPVDKDLLTVSSHFSELSEEADDGLVAFGEKREATDIIGLPRLSRLSSQFLPPNGCRIVQVPIGNFELRYSYLSQRGYYPEALDKANQDSFCVHTQFGGSPNDHFFGVFDGHGEFGSECSQYVKKHLCENLLRNRKFTTDAVQSYHSAFLATNLQLHRASIDDSMSGTTGITVLVRGKKLYIANVGDSRAVIGEWRENKLVAVDLSNDQTPFRKDECERVKVCGARVLTLDQLEGLKSPNVQCWGGEEDDDGDPPRLWVANGMYPGTAFTRSLGDTVAERIGVTAVPEVMTVDITVNHPFFVVASDGVFEFLTSQDVVDMVEKYDDPRDACAAVVAESYRLWLQYETRTDDITIIVVHIDQHAAEAEEEEECKPRSSRHNSESFEHVGYRPAPCELSAARLRAIEASLEHDSDWLPPSNTQPKTQEDKERIKRALQGNFLFHNLTEKQWETLYDCFNRIHANSGDIIIRQGSEDDHFYIVENGEFEVLISQEGEIDGGNLGTVVSKYTADSSSCFGELALMYNKPRQATVRCVEEGNLWMLTREAFRGLLLMNSRRAALKHLRAIDVLSSLSIGQLVRLTDSLSEIRFQDGESILEKEGRELSNFYLIRKGEVDLTYNETANVVRKGGGSYFGEWIFSATVPQQPQLTAAVAVGDVECWAVNKQAFDDILNGGSNRTVEDELNMRGKMQRVRNEQMPGFDMNSHYKDLEWQGSVYCTDCCEIGVVKVKGTEQVVSMKRYSLEKIRSLGREAQVLREKSIFQELNPSIYVPQMLLTCADERFASMLLNTRLAGPLSLILRTSLDESSARYISASLVLALQFLHKDGLVYRGVSPDTLMLDWKGRLQLADFRFAKKLSDADNQRTYTICGMADFLAPEVINGQGHSFAADWWAVGVLVYYMLQNELPFGSWRDSELDIYSRIAGRQLTFPSHFGRNAVDLIDKLLMVDVKKRLVYGDEIKEHEWFSGVNWEGLMECQLPQEIRTRLSTITTSSSSAAATSLKSPPQDGNYPHPPWLDTW